MILDNIRRRIANLLNPDKQINKYNHAFLGGYGNGYTTYDHNAETYIDKGYNVNPLVYSLVNQMAQKTAQVPFYIKDIEDKENKRLADMLMHSTKGDLSLGQKMKYNKLVTKAYAQSDKPFPMERPNPNQTWTEFVALYKTFLKCTGNVYIYLLAPEEGINAGEPRQIYILPSHLIQIITDKKVDILEDEDPVSGYLLTYGRQCMEFEADNVIHIKYSNPNFDEHGEHLYGLSPLKAALQNIQSSNVGLDLNIKTLKSGGAFGLIHGKSQSLTKEQADSIKERLIEMDTSTDRLAKIAGVSAEVGFTRLSLTSDELKPFDYFNFDERQIANCLQWEVLDEGRGDYGGTINAVRKQRVTDNIQPDLKLLEQALNTYFLPRFKGYEDACIVFDVMELPEMQSDVKEITEWLNNALDRGVINRNEYREAIQYLKSDDDIMEAYTVTSDIIGLEEALDNDFTLTNGTTS